MLSLLILSTFLVATPSPAPAPSSTPAAATALTDSAVTDLAKDWLRKIQIVRIDRAQLTDEMNAALTDSVVRSLSANLAPLNDPVFFRLVDKQQLQGLIVYTFRLQFANTAVNEILTLDPDGKIAGLVFRQAR